LGYAYLKGLPVDPGCRLVVALRVMNAVASGLEPVPADLKLLRGWAGFEFVDVDSFQIAWLVMEAESQVAREEADIQEPH
jgi:hypothetical protein